MPWTRYKRADPRRHITHLKTVLGRRGTVLALLGVVWVFMGISVLVAPESPTYLLLTVASLPRGILWIVTGVVAIMCASAPQGRDAIGFLSLYLMAWYKVLAYALGAYFWVITGGEDGDLRGTIGAAAWLTILLLILIVSGWRETDEGDAP